MNTFSKSISKNPVLGLTSIAIILLIFAIWLPFGFSLIALIEEWGVLGMFTKSHMFFWVSPHSVLKAHALRPLTILPHALAYYFTPNSFDAWHVLLILSLWIKGMAGAYLIRFLTRSNAFGLLAGILMVIYPADTMQLAFRGIHINWAVSCFLLASVGWLNAFNMKNNWQARVLNLCSSLLYLMSLFLYEAVLPLFLFPLLIFLTREGLQATIENSKQKKAHIASWIFVLLLWAAYEAWAAPQIHSYQSSFKSEWSPSVILKMPAFIWVGLWRGFFTGWFDAFRILIREISFWGYAYLFLFSCILFSMFSYGFSKEKKISPQHSHQSVASPKNVFLLGMLIIFLGFSTFLFAPSHVMITQRTYLCASIGGVIAWVGMWRGMYSRFPIKTHIVIFLFLMAGLSQQLFQFQQYVQISNRQRYALRQMVDQLDIHAKAKKILIVDESEQLNQVWFLLLPNIEAAFYYIGGHPVPPVEICYPSLGLWSHSENQIDGYCYKKGSAWIFKGIDQKARSMVSEKSIQVIRLKPEAETEISHENSLHFSKKMNSENADFNAKYKNILIHPIWQDRFQFLWRSHSNSYRWTVGDYWNITTPIRGIHWSEPTWSGFLGLFPKSFIWMEGKQATLQFYFVPQEGTLYDLRGYAKILDKTQFKTSISLNGHPLSVSWKYPYWHASISEEELKSGWNQLIFSNDQVGGGDFFALNEFEILPIKK